MDNQRPRFNPEQRQQLLTLGILEAQIARLERDALQPAEYALRQLPRLQDVRDELAEVKKAISDAKKALSRLLSADDESTALGETLQRVINEDLKMQGDGQVLERLLYPLAAANAVVERAQKTLPDEQRRPHSASFYPIQLIDEALRQGFQDSQPDVEEANFKLSSSPNSLFRNVVGICYEAMGQASTDPYRAITAYLAWKKAQADSAQSYTAGA